MSSIAEPSTDPAVTANRYKTELCRSFEELGVCRYGDKCQYAHGGSELRTLDRHPRHKTELCRSFHTTGLCPYGYRCHFIHNEAQTLMTSLDHAERGRKTLMTSLNDAEKERRKMKDRILGLIARNVVHQQVLNAITSVARNNQVRNFGGSSPTDPDVFGPLVVSPPPSMKPQHEPIMIPNGHRTSVGGNSRRLYYGSPDSPSFLCTSLSSVSSGGETSQTWSSVDETIPSPSWSSCEDACCTTSFRYNSPPPSISPRDTNGLVPHLADELTVKYPFY